MDLSSRALPSDATGSMLQVKTEELAGKETPLVPGVKEVTEIVTQLFGEEGQSQLENAKKELMNIKKSVEEEIAVTAPKIEAEVLEAGQEAGGGFTEEARKLQEAAPAIAVEMGQEVVGKIKQYGAIAEKMIDQGADTVEAAVTGVASEMEVQGAAVSGLVAQEENEVEKTIDAVADIGHFDGAKSAAEAVKLAVKAEADKLNGFVSEASKQAGYMNHGIALGVRDANSEADVAMPGNLAK